MTDDIALIAVDWGTTNRRAWAIAADGRIVDEKTDSGGLLAIPKGGFRSSFIELTGSWRGEGERIPAVMCGMVGSKLGWVEAPYVFLPSDMKEISRSLIKVPGIEAVWIVPGACDDHGEEPDVMRGEECQILGAMLDKLASDALLILPGTHSKWAVVERHRLTRFRTYMTGEMFGMLRGSGTIAQLIEGGEGDSEAFIRGVARISENGSSLLHALFGVRTLALFERIERHSLASYLSGVLIGAEMTDALRWAAELSIDCPIVAIGSPQLLANYDTAAKCIGIELNTIDSSSLLPRALFAIAHEARLMSS